MTASFWGTLALNLSFIFYLFVYVPQLVYNRKGEGLGALSLWMHLILTSAYVLDLLYGFLNHYPWQYRLVSCVGLALMLIQHLQLMHFIFKQKKHVSVLVYGLGFMCAGAWVMYECLLNHACPLERLFLLGFISRILFLGYTMPQLIKNRSLQSARGISLYFVLLSLMIACLDTTAAWCLNWGWPNRWGSPLSMVLMLGLLYQIKTYDKRTIFDRSIVQDR